MGRLIVESVTLADFMSYGPEGQTITFGGKGPVAVTGENGSGKSSATSRGVTWCLYGKGPPERAGTHTKAISGKDVIRRGGKEARVVVTFNRARVTRTRGKSGSDRVLVEELSAGEWREVGTAQSDVDALIGGVYDVFVRTVVRGQDDVYNFAEATDARKREIVEAISGAEELEPPFRIAKLRQGKIVGEASTVERLLASAEDRLSSVNVAGLEESLKSWDANHAVQVLRAQADVTACEASVAEAVAADALVAKGAEKRHALAAQRPYLDRVPYDQAIKREEEAHRAALSEASGLQSQVQVANRLKVGDACTTCGQIVAPDAPIAQRQKELAIPVKDAETKLSDAAAKLRTAREALQGAQDWLRTVEEGWRGQLDALPASGAPREPSAQQALGMAKANLGTVSKAANPYRVALDQARAGQAEQRREVAVLRESLALLYDEKLYADAWVDVLGPKGARAHLGDATLAAIEMGANAWLSMLSGGALSVEFPATKETQKGATREEIQTVVYVNGKPQPLLNFSGGEKARINMAVDMGVASVFARGGALCLSMLVLDEAVFSGMDESGKKAVANALHHAGVADVVIVDHDPRLASSLPRTIEVTRGSDGYSVILEVS